MDARSHKVQSPQRATEPLTPARQSLLERTADLAVAIDAGRELAGRLVLAHAAGPLADAERAAARERAAVLAADARLCFVHLVAIEEELPESLWPHAALRVAEAVASCLVALAAEEPEPLALLSRDELDGLAERHGAKAWRDAVLGSVRAEDAR